MVKTNTTISIDSDVKEKASKILKEKKGVGLSIWVEQSLRQLIEENLREVKRDGNI